MMTMTRLRGALLLCLLASLMSCATPPVKTRTVTVTEPVVVAVPPTLTAPELVPKLPAGTVTNADLAHYILLLRQALANANAKLKAIAGIGPAK